MADETETAIGKGPASQGTQTNVDPLLAADRVDDDATDASYSIGQVLAERYRVKRYIARGGMGEVYEVLDEELGELVALKTILPKTAGDASAVDRFRREIQIARKVSHPNVCRIFDLGRHVSDGGEATLFLTMELLRGRSLRARLKQGTMAPDEALEVVRQLAVGLGAAHRLGIVHRDLKPSNIFLVPDGETTRVVIADFGLARTEVQDTSFPTVTGTGEILGTPAYMSPEQLEGQSATTASDVYALGLIMYEMLTGVRAFEGDSAFQMALNKLREEPTSPSAHISSVPPRWDRTILRCLEKNPSDRIADVEEIPAILEGGQRLPLDLRRKIVRHPVIWAAMAVVLLIAGIGLGIRSGWWPTAAVSSVDLSDLELRRSVAVLGFQNNTGDSETAWISTALQEFLTTELAAGGALRAVPSQSVAHARAELGVDQIATMGPETLERFRELLTADLLVLGSFTVLGSGNDSNLRLDLRIQDIPNDELIVVEQVAGSLDDLFEIATRAAAGIRIRLGLDVSDRAAAAGALPADPVAARLYAEGVVLMRSFDPDGARSKLEQAVEADPESALIWLELANAWTQLGYGDEAIAAAARSKELSEGLGRETRLLIEARYQMLSGRMNEAVDSYRSLWLVYPDNIEYGIGLANAQGAAGRADAALETVGQLRLLPEPLSNDPRIDLAEAEAAGESGDAALQAEAAGRVVAASQRLGLGLLEAQARLALGSALRNTGRLDEAMVELETARELQASAGNRAGEASALYSLALVHLANGDLEAGIETTLECLATAREVGARIIVADALNVLGSIEIHQGDFNAAKQTFETALELHREIGNKSGEADALQNVALVQMWSGDFLGAIDSFNQVRISYRELGRNQQEAVVVMNLARIDAARGDLDGARSLFEEAAGMHRAQGSGGAVAEALFGLGEVLLTQGDLDGARTRHEEAFAIRREQNLSVAVESRFALAGLSLNEAALGRRGYPEAVEDLTEAVAALREQQRDALEADALNYLAEAQLGAGMAEDAEITLERVRELAGSANSVTLMVLRINEIRLVARDGRVDDAVRLLDELTADARTQSSLGVELEARLVAGEILADAGRGVEARRRLDTLRQDATARGWILVADKAVVIGRRLGFD